MSQAKSSYAAFSGDERMDESDIGRSEDMSDAAMEVGSVADSEMSSRQTVSTLYPHDSISQRGAQNRYPAPQSVGGSVADIHGLNSDALATGSTAQHRQVPPSKPLPLSALGGVAAATKPGAQSRCPGYRDGFWLM
ncbi:hypothetical protein FRB97_003142, partial [Tulasnella sp. 331]